MSTELKDKLEQAKARKSDVTIRMEAMGPSLKALVELQENRRDEIALLDTEIADLEKQIAAEAKPELSRDGDYSFRENSDYIHVKFGKDIFNNFGGKNPFGYDPTMDIMQGNIFDDLKAMQETVTEFEMKSSGYRDLQFEVDNSETVCITIDGELALNLKLDELILKLRQMQATLKRNK